MTTATKSAYPVPVDDLLPQARQLSADLGELPSRNRLMSELRIGAKKANTLLDLLDTAAPEPHTANLGRLHVVSSADSQESSDEPTQPLPEGHDDEHAPGPEPAESGSANADEPDEPTAQIAPEPVGSEQVSNHASPGPPVVGRPVPRWPVLLLALPAFVAIWSGWVGLGGLTGFGIVHPLPGIWSGFEVNTAITLPIGVETYAAYALRVWLSGRVPQRARRFAKVSALGSLALGALGQIAYHLMTATDMTTAPWWITTLVACLPVAVLGMGAALTHLLHTDPPEVSP
ncbi:ABC transporter permease [Saccharopolyspora sp. HNM0986]|uniref:ABC transporter permease n=1 Tax=Saccharopolyspora galaxeae TaxID=2781241 RepID=UPI00190DF568|nr:ABC transporter permease [Saccharopolyspora sp. HNM0986]MBK0865477.1 ABC transporter permease [Saccharopolyspora sp. HNM0986]